MSSNVKITSDLRTHPNLRKLARALLMLAERQLEAGDSATPVRRPAGAEVVKPETGDAA